MVYEKFPPWKVVYEKYPPKQPTIWHYYIHTFCCIPLSPDSTRAPMYAGVVMDDKVPGVLQLLDDDWTLANCDGYTQLVLIQQWHSHSQLTTLGPFWRHSSHEGSPSNDLWSRWSWLLDGCWTQWHSSVAWRSAGDPQLEHIFLLYKQL